MKLLLLDNVCIMFLSLTKYHDFVSRFYMLYCESTNQKFQKCKWTKNLNLTDLLLTWFVISLLFKHIRVNKEAYDMTDIYETSFHLAFPFVSCRQTVCCCCGMWRFGKLTSGYLCLFRADSRLPALCDLSFTSVVFVTWE